MILTFVYHIFSFNIEIEAMIAAASQTYVSDTCLNESFRWHFLQYAAGKLGGCVLRSVHQ